MQFLRIKVFANSTFTVPTKMTAKEVKLTQIQAVNTSNFGNLIDFYFVFFLQIHLSFSLYGTAEGQIGEKKPQFHFSILGLFLESIGVVLADIHDVIFKQVC